MARIAQSPERLNEILGNKWKVIKGLCEKYDAGEVFYAQNLANEIRLLLHDEGQSSSLLGQVGLKDRKILDTKIRPMGMLVGSYNGLFLIPSGTNNQYVPLLDGYRQKPVEQNFEDWWNGVVITDGKGQQFSRKQIVLYVTEQGGGAHVDPKLSVEYADLTTQNSMGWKSQINDLPPRILTDADYAAVRQIAHELLRTYVPDYPKQEMKIAHGTVGLSEPAQIANRLKFGRNEPCPCGAKKSDGNPRKYKKCCGS